MADARTDLTDLLRTRRADLGLAYERLGQRCVDPETGTRVSGSWLHRLETGLPVNAPTLEQLRAIAAGLGLPLANLQDAAGAQFLGIVAVHPEVSPSARILLLHAEGLSPDDLETLVDIAESLKRRRAGRTSE